MPIPKELKPFDIHIIFNGHKRKIKLYDSTGKLRYALPARGEAVGGTGYGKNERCPPGDYLLGHPAKTQHDFTEYGKWMISVCDMDNILAEHGRAGILIHGGGSGLKNPLAPFQGWVKTYGCIRMQNQDLEKLVNSVKYTQNKDGVAYLTVNWA